MDLCDYLLAPIMSPSLSSRFCVTPNEHDIDGRSTDRASGQQGTLPHIESYDISACAMRHVRSGIIPALVRCGG